MTTTRRRREVLTTRELAPGVRLHLLRTARFTTSYCRVVLHRDLGPEATATAVLGQVLQSATARHPTRQALAHRLGDLYGAALHVGTSKLGDRQVLVGSLDWPTAHVPRARRTLQQGLALLREVLTEPKRAPDGSGALDPAIVDTERVNHARALRSLRDDKGRYAMRRCLATMCRGEPYGLDAMGREEDLRAAGPAQLAALHARLTATAPVEIFLVADLGLREAAAAVRSHLLWPGRAARIARPPRVSSVKGARPRPRRVVEDDDVVQGKLVLGLRGAVRPGTAACAAAETLSGVLGGGSYARLFKVVREVHGLCYYASSGWHRAKGLLVIQTGVEAESERRARRMILDLVREVSSGTLEPSAHHGYLQAVQHRVAALADSPRALVAWHQERTALGLDPSPENWLDAQRAVTPAAVRRVGGRLALDTSFYLRPRAAGSGAGGRRG